MTTDRELLELAAKAAGYWIKSWWERYPGEWWVELLVARVPGDPPTVWNPLRDDGDALRLAVKLFLFVDSAAGAPDSFGAELVRAGNEVVDKTEPRTHDDPYAATRRAIVRAAAEIGRAMP